MWMYLESVIQSEVSKKEKQISYINTYIWNLDKCYLWTYLQSRNRNANIGNILVDTVREGEGETNWESSIDILYTTICKIDS